MLGGARVWGIQDYRAPNTPGAMTVVPTGIMCHWWNDVDVTALFRLPTPTVHRACRTIATPGSFPRAPWVHFRLAGGGAAVNDGEHTGDLVGLWQHACSSRYLTIASNSACVWRMTS